MSPKRPQLGVALWGKPTRRQRVLARRPIAGSCASVCPTGLEQGLHISGRFWPIFSASMSGVFQFHRTGHYKAGNIRSGVVCPGAIEAVEKQRRARTHPAGAPPQPPRRRDRPGNRGRVAPGRQNGCTAELFRTIPSTWSAWSAALIWWNGNKRCILGQREYEYINY